MSSVADSIPKQGLEFGYCGVYQTSTRTLQLHNPTTNVVRYEIVAENIPFEISPLKGNKYLRPRCSNSQAKTRHYN